MRPAKTFTFKDGPLYDTFSFGPRPCRLDETSLQDPNGAEPACPFKSYCSAAEGDLDVLRVTYGERIKVTLSEASSSIVARSEHQYSKDPRVRLSLRKHFYEVNADAATTCGTMCEDMDLDRSTAPVFGEYLGFVDLRLHYQESPIALALLAPPRKLREDRNASIILGQFGPIIGAHKFPCTVYSMQDPTYGAAYCAQACVIMAAAMLSDRGVKIVGPYTLSYLAGKGRENADACRAGNAQCDTHRRTTSPTTAFAVGGLNSYECSNLLKRLGAEAVLITFDETWGSLAEMEGYIGPLIDASISARFPVIMYVDPDTWYRGDPEYRPEQREPAEGVGHAVTVVGARRDVSGRITSLIIHDPGKRPFHVRSLSECVELAWNYPPTLGTRYAAFTFTADAKLTFHAYDCVNRLRSGDGDSLFIDAALSGELRISLHHRDDLTYLFPSERGAYRDEEIDGLPDDRYWCVDARSAKHGRAVWLFRSSLDVSALPNYERRLDFPPPTFEIPECDA